MASDVIVAGLLGGAKAFSDEYDRMSEEASDIRAEQRRLQAEKEKALYMQKLRVNEVGLINEAKVGLMQNPAEYAPFVEAEELENIKTRHSEKRKDLDVARIRRGDDEQVERQVSLEGHMAGLWRAGMTEEQAKDKYLIESWKRGETPEAAEQQWEDNYSDGRFKEVLDQRRQEEQMKSDIAVTEYKKKSNISVSEYEKERDIDIAKPKPTTKAAIQVSGAEARRAYDDALTAIGVDMDAISNMDAADRLLNQYASGDAGKLDTILADPGQRRQFRNELVHAIALKDRLLQVQAADSGEVASRTDVWDRAVDLDKRAERIMQLIEQAATEATPPSTPDQLAWIRGQIESLSGLSIDKIPVVWNAYTKTLANRGIKAE